MNKFISYKHDYEHNCVKNVMIIYVKYYIIGIMILQYIEIDRCH